MRATENTEITKILFLLKCVQDQAVDNHNTLADIQAALVALEQKPKTKEERANYRTDPKFLAKLIAGIGQSGWPPVEEFDRPGFPEPIEPPKSESEQQPSTNGYAPQAFNTTSAKSLLIRTGG